MSENIDEKHGLFEYGFLRRIKIDNSQRIFPNINAFYGPWDNIESAKVTIKKELNLDNNLNGLPIGFTIAVYTNDSSQIQELWWLGKSFELKNSGGESGGGGIIPITIALQVWPTNSRFVIGTNADGKCTNEALKRATATSICIVNNGEQITGALDQFILETLNDDVYKINYKFNSSSGTYDAWLEFKDDSQELNTVVAKNIFVSYKTQQQYGQIAFLIEVNPSALTYYVSNVPESFYIPDTGVIPEVIIDIDAYDPYNNETYVLKQNDLILNITYDHLEDGRYKRDQVGNDILYNGDKWRFGPDSMITINGSTMTLQQLYNKNNEQYLKTGEAFSLTIKNKDGLTVSKGEVRIIRSTAISGPGQKEYDVSLTDEYISIPAGWIGKADDTISTNIQSATNTLVKIEYLGEQIEDYRITSVTCQNEAIEYLLDDKQTYLKPSQDDNDFFINNKVIGYRFTALESDDVVTVTVHFNHDDNSFTDSVTQTISAIDTVSGETYSLICSDLALGVDKNDDKNPSSYELVFRVNKNQNGEVSPIKFTRSDIFGKNSTNIGNNTCVQLLYDITDRAITNTGINNIQGSLRNDNQELHMTFSVEEAEFDSMSLRFCLWMNGSVYDYGNVGIYILPKDGASYDIVTSTNIIPTNALGKLSEEFYLTIKVVKQESGKLSLLKGCKGFKRESDNTFTYSFSDEDKDAEYYIGFRSLDGSGCDTRFADYNQHPQIANSLLYNSGNDTYRLNVLGQFYSYIGKNANNINPDTAELNWKGFTIVVMRITKQGKVEWITKDIYLVQPGKDGKDGQDGAPGKDGIAGAQIRYLGEWSDTKCYCYLSDINSANYTEKYGQYKEDGASKTGWMYTNLNSNPIISNTVNNSSTEAKYLWTQDGIRYLDVVSIGDKYYQALQNSRNYKPGTITGYWGEAQHFGMLVTDAMITKALNASTITTDEILIKDINSSEGEQKYIGGFTNVISKTLDSAQKTKENNLVIWSGASKNSGEDAKFKVYADGTLKCTGLDSSINGLITSTNEVEVPLSKLELYPVYSKVADDQGEYPLICTYVCLDFTKFGSNIKLVDDIEHGSNETDSDSNIEKYLKGDRHLFIDLPAYAYTNVINDGHGIISVFKDRGCKSEDQVKEYMRHVSKYKTTNVRIRTAGIKGLASIAFRGCLSIDRLADNNSVDLPWKIQEQDIIQVLRSSLGRVQSEPNVSNTNSINDIIDLEIGSTIADAGHVYLPTSRNGSTCYLDYPYANYNANGEVVTAFDICFEPRDFTMKDNLSIISFSGSSYDNYLDSKLNGMYWESTNIYHLSKIEANALN